MTWRRRLRRWWQARRQARIDRRRLRSLGTVDAYRAHRPYVSDRTDCHVED